MVLTSVKQFEDITRCEKLGIPSHVLKPVKELDLFDAIMTALGMGSSQPWEQPATTPLPQLAPLQILLAEDNPINQKPVVGLLQKHGHYVTVVHNGKEAVNLTKQRKFDLVLMDIQMPEMDGFEATAILRARERQTGAHLPIVAMTAHVMKGDRERCLAAGMDDYVGKPFQAETLLITIARALGRSTATPPPAPEPAAGTDQPVDWAQALQTVQGDEQLLREVLSALLEELPTMMESVRTAAAADDAAQLRNAAHTLKGSLGCCGAQAAHAAAYRLETVAAQQDMAQAQESLLALEREVARIPPVLIDYLKRAKPAS
jgi:CheY-like chemotaxis protein